MHSDDTFSSEAGRLMKFAGWRLILVFALIFGALFVGSCISSRNSERKSPQQEAPVPQPGTSMEGST